MKHDRKTVFKILEYVALVVVFVLIAFVIISLNSEPEFEDLGESPTIELMGEKRFVQLLGNEFEDPGVKAIDAHGNDISDRVTVQGELNLEEEGTNFLYYSVADIHGNKSREIVRLVIVQSEQENDDSIFVVDEELLEEIIVQEIERHKEDIQKIQNSEDPNSFYRYDDCGMIQFLSPYVEIHFNINSEPERKLMRTTIREVLEEYEF